MAGTEWVPQQVVVRQIGGLGRRDDITRLTGHHGARCLEHGVPGEDVEPFVVDAADMHSRHGSGAHPDPQAEGVLTARPVPVELTLDRQGAGRRGPYRTTQRIRILDEPHGDEGVPGVGDHLATMGPDDRVQLGEIVVDEEVRTSDPTAPRRASRLATVVKSAMSAMTAAPVRESYSASTGERASPRKRRASGPGTYLLNST